MGLIMWPSYHQLPCIDHIRGAESEQEDLIREEDVAVQNNFCKTRLEIP